MKARVPAERYTGASVRRVEDERLLTGGGSFVADAQLPGMLHAAFCRSPLPHARILAVNTEAARLAPGVVAVFDGAQMAQMASPVADAGDSPRSGGPVSFGILAVDKARLVGDPVALVVAQSRALAEDACELIQVEYEELAPVVTVEQALDPSLPAIFEELGGNRLFGPETRVFGDVEGAFARADRVVRASIRQHRHQNVPMEGRAILANFDAASGQLLVRAATQGVNTTRQMLAEQLRMPLDRVRVVAKDVGGSFGLKFGASREEVACCAASRELGCPVRWIEDRWENLTVSGQAREESFEVEAAVTAAGRILALKVEMVIDSGAYPGFAPGVVDIVREMIPGPYRLEALSFTGSGVVTNKASYVAYRGPWASETFVRERMIDLVAQELGISAPEVRLRNLAVRDELPLRMVTGPSLAGITARESLLRAVEIVDLTGFREEQLRLREEGRYLGIGFATYIEPAPGPRRDGGEESTEQVRVELDQDGSLLVHTAQMPHGQGHRTTLAQVAADEFGARLEQVQVMVGDTQRTPTGFGTGGSRFAAMAGGAALHGARRLRGKVLEAAAQILDLAPTELDISGGELVGPGVPGGRLPLAELVGRIDLAARSGRLPPGTDADLTATADFDGGQSGWSGGTHGCVVEVDAATGLVRILRYLVVEDCGDMINPAVVDGQIRGGVAQGVGAVLLERSAYDPEGQYLSATLMDYLLPTALDVPNIEIEHLSPVRLDPDVNFRGVGEGGMIAAPPTICNAIADALSPFGPRVLEQHLPPTRILELIGALPD